MTKPNRYTYIPIKKPKKENGKNGPNKLLIKPQAKR